MADKTNDEQSRSDAEPQASPNKTRRAGRSNGQQQSANGGGSDGQTGATAVSPSLQEQIAQAIQPIVSDLRQQITQSLQHQMAGGQDAGTQEQGGMQAALSQTTTAMQEAFAWLRQMAVTVVETVRAWIEKAVAFIRRLALSMAAQGIKAAAKPLVTTAARTGVGILQDQGKQRLEAMRQRVPGAGQAPETATAEAAG